MSKLTICPERFSLAETLDSILPNSSWQGYNCIVLLVFGKKSEARTDFERAMELRWKKCKLEKKWTDLSKQV